MEISTKIDLETVAKNLELPVAKVSSAVELLEAGNTIPFITRYRKDETGGLGERQLRDVKQEVARQVALSDRKSFVLKAIENQGKLTDHLRKQIDNANQSRQIEDLYRPFKPRKTSLAEAARQQGLEPLARDILEGHQPDTDLASRATDFVRVDKGLTSVDDVIRGVKHILAERFSEHLQLRARLRNLIWQSGALKTELVAISDEKDGAPKSNTTAKEINTPEAPPTPTKTQRMPPAAESDSQSPIVSDPNFVASENPAGIPEIAEPSEPTAVPSPAPTSAKDADLSEASSVARSEPAEAAEPDTGADDHSLEQPTPVDRLEPTPQDLTAAASPEPSTPSPGHSESAPAETITTEKDSTPPTELAPALAAAVKPKKKRKKKKKKKSRPDPFAEFASFEESLQKTPPHRVLAINRGERAGKLRVKIGCDLAQLNEIARAELIPADHPFAEFLTTVCDDALSRLIMPSIEREIRRDLTDRSETHAVNVFARNLRHLFLQPPMRGYRVMGIDPGYRSGCKVAVIDETGQPLGHGVFSIVGNPERIKNNQQRLIDLIQQHQPHLIAIGNGSGCRSVEQFVSDVISGTLADRELRYSIVNQAGTSTYSTSELGQFELPDHDPVIRSAISIARRLQDPLSELVKVNPANVGVGLYQHDIKAKHLAESLEHVVESCVNYVGVNANTASPSLLKYVSGLGQTTARKLVEHRNQQGAFRDREKLKEVAGFGDVTFVQSAGFLRIDSPNALDQTSIHPEDYDLANRILTKLGASIEELIPPPRPPRRAVAARPATPDTATAADNVASTPVPAAPESDPAASDIGTSAPQPAAPESDTPSMANPVQAPPVAAPQPPPENTLAGLTDGGPSGPHSSSPEIPPAVATLSPAVRAEKQKRRKELVQKIKGLDARQLANEFGVGELKLRDLLRALRNPVQDPREDLPAPVFRKGILKFDDLKQGLQLRGQIVNVVDFGVFLNIGIGESCLVHISRLANRYVRDPHWFYSVGDVMNVWVQEIDPEKRRVTLTAIRPDTGKRERSRPKGDAASGRHKRSDRGRGRGGPPTGGKGKRHHTTGRGKPHSKKPRKPKPVTPITDEMVEGKEPMRSFSDLMQFHKRKADDEPKDKS